MTRHEALRDLSAVLRETAVALPKVESGPAALSASQRAANVSSTAVSKGSGGASLFSHVLPVIGGGVSSLFAGFFGKAGGSSGSRVTDLLGLLGGSGGGNRATAALPLYSAPQRVQVQAGLRGGVVSSSDTNSAGGSRGGQPQVTLHIQAMDTQSILNRSTDIAQAVRQAMLQSHPINDVVADL